MKKKIAIISIIFAVLCKEGAAEGGADDWGEVVTR